INPYFKIINIISNLTSGTLYTANVASYFEHADSVGTHTYDSAFTTITFAGDKYQTLVDSVETVQDDLYNLTIDNRDSLIVIAPTRHVYAVLFREDILDSTFQQNYLDSIYIPANDTGALRNIIMTFKYSSPYYSYLLAYDTAVDFLVVKNTIRNSIPIPPDGSYTITAPTTNYTSLFTYAYILIPSVPPVNPFDTGKYISRSGSSFVAVAPYTNYKIINQLPNQ
ncbi:MAG TPA: hypothetical protein VLD19_10185, partial [Chitinophagaceae bacterium]|nr:hypothetical protein [Chitinophagaceae bacterium]